jgi:phosphoglycolate phosphatase
MSPALQLRLSVGPMAPLIQHVMFDLDGTLIDSRADLAGSLNHVLAALGLATIAPATVFGYVGNGARALVERALGPQRRAEWDRGVELFLAHYGTHLLDQTELYPGVRDALAALAAAGIALSVLTNKPEGMSRRILAGLDISSRFVDVVAGDTLPTRKPHPAGVAQLLARTATPAARALLVGDSPIDLATAQAAGVAFCGVGWGLDLGGLRSAGAAVVADAPALARLVLGWG